MSKLDNKVAPLNPNCHSMTMMSMVASQKRKDKPYKTRSIKKYKGPVTSKSNSTEFYKEISGETLEIILMKPVNTGFSLSGGNQ